VLVCVTLQVPKHLATIACKAGTDHQAYGGSLAAAALMVLLSAAQADVLQELSSTGSATSSQHHQRSSSVVKALAAALTQQIQLSSFVQQLPAVLRKAALEVQELRVAAQQQPLMGYVSTFGINADYGKGFLVDSLLGHATSVLQIRCLLADLWPPTTFPGLGTSLLPAGQLAVQCLQYLSDVYNALPEQQMTIELDGFQSIVASCCGTAMDLTYAASMALYGRPVQPTSAMAQQAADLNSSTAEQICQDLCYVQCTGLAMATVAYHLVIQHNPAFSSSAKTSDASGADSADPEDADPDYLSDMRQFFRGLQERQAMKDAQRSSSRDTGTTTSNDATSTAAIGLQSRLPQLHMQLLQELGFSSKLVAVVAAMDCFTPSHADMCMMCANYAGFVDYMTWRLGSGKDQGTAKQQGQGQQQQQQQPQAQQYAAVHVCLGSLLLSWAANMPPGDSHYLQDCFHAANAATAGLQYWSHLQTRAWSAEAASHPDRAEDTATALQVLRMPLEEQQERMVRQLQKHAGLALLPEGLAAELTRETLPTVLHMLTQLLLKLQPHSCARAATPSAAACSSNSSSSSSSSSGRGVSGGGKSTAARRGATGKSETKGSPPGALPVGTDHAATATASGTTSSTVSKCSVTASMAVNSVLDYTRLLAAHTSHASQKGPILFGSHARGPDRKPHVVAWDQHAAKLSLLLEKLLRLEAEQPGLLAANNRITTMWCIGAMAVGCTAGSYHIVGQLQDAAAVAAPGGVLQSRYCSLLTSLFKYYSKQAQAALEFNHPKQLAGGALSILEAVGWTDEGFIPRRSSPSGAASSASSAGSRTTASSPAAGLKSDLGLPGGSKRLSNMVPALNLLGRCLVLQGLRLQSLESKAAGQAAQPGAAADEMPLSTTAAPSAAAPSTATSRSSEQAHQPQAVDAAAADAAAVGDSGAVITAASQQVPLASDASRTYLQQIGAQTLLTLSATSAWLPRGAGSLLDIPLQDQEVTAHVKALGGSPELLAQQREATVAAWHAVEEVEAASHSAMMAFAQQLSAFGRALCSLPFPQGCNNPSCTNTEGLTESELIKGSSKTCAGCHKARYCCKACQQQARRLHKPVCRALAAAVAAGKAPGGISVDG